MKFSPPGALVNGTYDYCAGVEAEQLIRPPTPYSVQVVSGILLGIALFVLALSVGMWLKYQHIPHLALGRVFLLSKGMDMGLLCMCSAVYIRFLSLKPNGSPTQSCLGTLFLYILGAFFPTNAYYLRLLVLLIKSRRARLIQQYNAGDDDDQSNVASTTTVETFSMSMREYFDFIVRSMFGLDDAAVLSQKHALYKAGEILKTRALVTMTVAIFCVMFIPMIVLPFVVDAYRGDCTGCQLYFEFLIAYLVVWLPLFPLALRLNMMVLKEADAYSNNPELVLCIVVGGVLAFPGMALLAVDPGNVDYYQQFMWEWIIAFGWIGTVAVWGPLQILYGLRQYHLQLKTPSAAYILNKLNPISLMNDLKNERFLEIARRQYVNENIQFLLDTKYWRSQYFDRNPQWRQKKAEHIANLFVRVGSAMEINIADDDRTKLLRDVAAKDVKDTLFKAAEKQVQDMLLQGAYKTFLLETYEGEDDEEENGKYSRGSKSNGAASGAVVPRSSTAAGE